MKSDSAVESSTDDGYYSEECFQRALILERKRSDRSGKPFMLILLDIGKLLKADRQEKKVALWRLNSALASSTREIDVKGWYLEDSIIGIIYVDVHKEDWRAVAGKLGKAFFNCNQFLLNAEKPDAVKMIRFFYPEIQDEQEYELNTTRSSPAAELTGPYRPDRAETSNYQ